jgi:dolichol-phosphate mannosyltransferase
VPFLRKAYKYYGEAFIEEKGFVCMVELLIKFGRFNPRVVEIPMVLNGNIREGKSKMKVGKTIASYIKLFLKNSLKGG